MYLHMRISECVAVCGGEWYLPELIERSFS